MLVCNQWTSWSSTCPNVRTLIVNQYQSQPGLTQLGNALGFDRIRCLAPQALELGRVPRRGLPNLTWGVHRACSTARGGNWPTFAWASIFGLPFLPFDLVSFKLFFSGLRTTTCHNKIIFDLRKTRGCALIWWTDSLLPSHWLSVCFSLGFGFYDQGLKKYIVESLQLLPPCKNGETLHICIYNLA